MSNRNERLTKDYLERNPKELPKELKGLDFFAVNKIRLNGNENRTTLFEFRPKQIKTLLGSIDQTVKKLVSDATKKLRRKQKELKAELKSANESVVNLDAALDETIAERDEALAQVQELSKKPSRASDDSKELKQLKRELERIKGLFEQKNNENKSLNTQLKNLQAGDQKDKTDLSKALKANADLSKYLEFVKAELLKRGVNLDDAVPENSGMVSGSDWLGKPTLLHSNKPFPSGNPGTRR